MKEYCPQCGDDRYAKGYDCHSCDFTANDPSRDVMTKQEMRFIRREYIAWYMTFTKNIDHIKENVRDYEKQEHGQELKVYTR